MSIRIVLEDGTVYEPYREIKKFMESQECHRALYKFVLSRQKKRAPQIIIKNRHSGNCDGVRSRNQYHRFLPPLYQL